MPFKNLEGTLLMPTFAKLAMEEASFTRRLADKFVSFRILRSTTILAIDLCLSLFSTFAILLFLNFLRRIPVSATRYFLFGLGLALICSLLCFLVFGTHRRIVRHTSFKTVGLLGLAAIAKNVLMALAYLILSKKAGWFGMPIGVVVIFAFMDFMLTFLMLVGVRWFLVMLYDYFLQHFIRERGENLLIYGIGKLAVSLVSFMKQSSYNLAGFLAHDVSDNALSIRGYNVWCFSNEKNLDRIFSRIKCKYILFPMARDIQYEKDRLVPYCQKHGIKMLISPNLDQVSPSNGFLKLGVREINVEDLLGRDEIKVDITELLKAFKGKKALVTGAAGSIGSELVRQLALLGASDIVMFDNAETPLHNIRLEMEDKQKAGKVQSNIYPVIGDVRSNDRLNAIFDRHKPDVVFHAAAYKHVPLMEENPCEAIHVNVVGTRNVADACVRHNVSNMIMISTDKAVNPTNVMGATKRAAELYVQSLAIDLKEGRREGVTKFTTTRFGNVLGSNGSVIPRFREQISSGGPVTVTHPDINRFFMSIPEAVRLVLEAATLGQGADIFVFDMGTPVKIADMATRMIELAGYVPGKDIQIEVTGFRPGEKIYEEVLSNLEQNEKTSNPKIYKAKVRQARYDDVVSSVDILLTLALDVKIPEAVLELKKLVPEFKSANSKFTELDKS